MTLWGKMLVYPAWIGLLLSSLPAWAQQDVGLGMESNSGVPVTNQRRASLDILPDSPGAVRYELQEQENRQKNLEVQSAQPAPATPKCVEPPPSQSQRAVAPPQKPVGTAAAGASAVSGMAASQPAGVAVAPAKQRRARTIVLRVGAIVGACAAVGTVVALTQATPSKPPGAR
jgi:hypothetical protein